MPHLTLHWSPIPADLAQKHVEDGLSLFALWPAPVNPDVCFEAAGFTDFGDNDNAWDIEADALLDRLLAALSRYGAARLVSEPLRPTLPWYRRLFSRAEALPLRQQIELPLAWDSLPDCLVAFGDQGVTLRTGKGHHLFWLALPATAAGDVPLMLEGVRGDLSLAKTSLKWEHLL